MSNQVIELASFRLADGASEATLIAASDAMQEGFLKSQKGFIKRDLVKGADGQWADVVYWDSQESVDAAMQEAMNNPACFKYFELMTGVNHEDVSAGVMHLSVLKSYL
ncbi:MAG TPA: hypothetical protein PKJ84_15285 [Anaerolineales bacterium]|nr:hypothetical protein [Anaerolineales bacterium]HMX19157.1 hypothetical protein [Anaerolineales bacterium]HMX74155.1 hypothetical protein [Anaerolineales bacterium]HMZ42793.1 hypothetical protein [Anaerolineales bacterium]HNA56412.1 hypothetical protein [Anaerolineales bacterium]